jgi:hypothetical protein
MWPSRNDRFVPIDLDDVQPGRRPDLARRDRGLVSGPKAPPARRRIGRAVAIGVLVVLVALALLIAVAWLNRRAAAREVLVGWLDRRGIQADVEVERLELNGFVGRVRIGDPADPDITVQRVEVDYVLGLPWSSGGLGVTPSRIRLVRPVARASWKDGKLSFGSLDPLIEEFTGRPPRPDSRGPIVVVETGRLRLDTEYGPLSLLADARVDDGKLMRLSARMPTASLRSGEIEARGLGGTLNLTTTGDRVALSLNLAAEAFAAAGLEGEAARLSGTADLPYPDLKTRRGDGRAALDLTLSGDRLAVGEVAATGAVLTLAADGQATGWIDTLGFNGLATARLRAGSLAAPGLSARSADVASTDARVVLARRADGLAWSLEGPARLRAASGRAGDLVLTGADLASSRLALSGGADGVQASGTVAATLSRATLDTLILGDGSGRFDLDFVSDRPTALILTGSLAARRGAWPLFGPVASDDVPELVEMKRALGAFALDVPALRLTSGGAAVAVALTRPARLTPANGGVLTLHPVATPIYAARPGQLGGGALSLTATRGAGLPEAIFAVPDWRLTSGGFTATLDGRAALDFGLARGLSVRTEGLLATDNGHLTYVPADCLSFAAERLELEENDVMDLAGSLCASGGPLVVSQDGRWRAGGRLTGVSASAPFLAMTFADIEGTAVATGSAAGLGMEAEIVSARVEDATRPHRFNPLTASGSATLAEERWSGAFDLMHDDTVLGRLTLAHDGVTGQGGVVIDAPSLVFAEGGLQPADLSPLAADFVQSPATGSAAFSGRLDWSEDLPEGSSSGRLVIPGLDFVSPAGAVKGLSGTIDFTNLAPLTTAPGQTLHVDTVESVADLTDLDLTFALDKAAFTVAGGQITAAGGTVSVEPFSVPLDRRPFSGVIVLDRVQLGELLAGSGFGDQVTLDAVVSGRLPFTSDPDAGIRISGGTLYAAQPGRLSIQREALADLEAGGGGEVPPNTVEDLAYQAMENLAFDVLTAEVNSLDEGRVGVMFHIVGRHDPPQHQELRLTLPELISREFLNRPLPLPSGTGIDLTLDTTLNLNQLIGDLLAVNRARNGEPDADQP